jgi:hypothetical protein
LKPGQTAFKVDEVWVVFKAQCDLGYTISSEEVFKKNWEEMINHAIKQAMIFEIDGVLSSTLQN